MGEMRKADAGQTPNGSRATKWAVGVKPQGEPVRSRPESGRTWSAGSLILGSGQRAMGAGRWAFGCTSKKNFRAS